MKTETAPRESRGAHARGPPAVLPHDAALPAPRRQGNPAQESEPDLFSDQRRRARGRARRGGPGPSARLRWFYPYYRDRALCLALGVTAGEMLLAAVGAKDDPASGGRQMPSHWGHKRLNIVSQSSPTGTQCLRAVGCADASLFASGTTRSLNASGSSTTMKSCTYPRRRHDERGRVLGVAEHGVRPEAACRLPRRGQRLRDLRPRRSADAGRRHLARRRVISRPQSSPRRRHGSTRQLSGDEEAVAHARERKGPALVHAKVIRPYSHSLSDDEKLYKTAEERAEEARRDPIPSFAALLKREGLVSDAELEAIAADVKAEITRATERARAATKPSKDTASLYVSRPTSIRRRNRLTRPPRPTASRTPWLRRSIGP